MSFDLEAVKDFLSQKVKTIKKRYIIKIKNFSSKHKFKKISHRLEERNCKMK